MAQGAGGNLPSVLYLDHAQIKLLARRLTHIKEKLAHEQIEFSKTKTGKFAKAMGDTYTGE